MACLDRYALQRSYPFTPITSITRNHTLHDITRIFLRDGCIDRYFGHRLIFPPVLRIISALLPDVFPYHPNWKMSACHIAYWELLPTIDHIIPVARGGNNQETNWLTTSQLHNSAKSNWMLQEIGWQILSPGNLAEWDGLIGWFLEFTATTPALLTDKRILLWHKALTPFVPTQVIKSTHVDVTQGRSSTSEAG